MRARLQKGMTFIHDRCTFVEAPLARTLSSMHTSNSRCARLRRNVILVLIWCETSLLGGVSLAYGANVEPRSVQLCRQSSTIF